MNDILENKTMENNKLDKEYIKSLIQDILNKSHNFNEKRRIVERKNEIVFACPICSDSGRNGGNNNIKRAHVYFNSMYMKCYNEESCSRSFTKLLKTFNVDMDLDKKLELYTYLDNNITYHNTEEVQFDKLDKLFNIKDLMDFYSDKKFRHITNLKPLQKGSVVYEHVVNVRKIPNTYDIYEGVYHYTDKWKQPVMVFMNKVKDKVVSMQVRNLLEGEKRLFKIYDFSKIYFEINPEGELDDQEKISYDKLSHFFNIFKVDFGSSVNMFEGYVDSLFLRNSIGMIGVNTDLSFLLKEDGLELRFIFDADKAGFKKSREMIEKKYKVFLWNKFFLDFIKDYKGKLPKDKLVESLKRIKDFNKLQLKFRKPIEQIFDFNKYFSNDELDIYYLMDLEQLYKMY